MQNIRNNHRNSGRMMPGGRLRRVLTLRRVIVSSFMILAASWLTFWYFSSTRTAKAAVAGDYRSKASGNWNNTATWEKFDGTTWNSATTTPVSTDGVITIQSGHTVTVTANATVDQVVVSTGGILTVSAGTLTIANGTGADLDVSGTANMNAGTLTISAGAQVKISTGGTYNYNGGTQTLTSGWAVSEGGTYVHNVDNVNVPTATWGATSTLKLTGIVSSDIKGLTQTFGNIVYNCPAQNGPVNFWDNITAVQGNITVISTGTGGLWLQRASLVTPMTISGYYLQTGGTVYGTKGAAFTYNIMGDFTVTGGTFIEVERYGLPVLNIYGKFLLTGGTFNHSTYSSNLPNEGIGTVNLYGNYERTGGSHTETATMTGRGDFNFTKTGTQTFTATGGTCTNTVNYAVFSGAILDIANYMVTSDGTFTLMSGGGLIMASPNGITATAASGNVQVTGTRSFSTGGDYTYNASSAQVTGNGLPATVHNITFDNVNNVTLTGSTSATNLVTLHNGKVITGSNELGTTNASTTSVQEYSSSKYVIGNLRRSVNATGDYDYPVGDVDYYELATVSFSGMAGIGSVLGFFTHAYPIEAAYPLVNIYVNGTPLDDMLDYGYWTLTPNSSMTAGTYSVTLKEQGHNNPGDPATYAVIKRPSPGTSWISTGTHTNSTQSEQGGVATAVRSALSAFSNFGIAKGGGPLPVKLVYFRARPEGNAVVCNWMTASEINSDYFSVERSSDGKLYEGIHKTPAAGMSSTSRYYSYTDEQPLEGLSYYRLMQTDYDGSYTYSQAVSVTRGKKASGQVRITGITPNPFVDRVSVFYENSTSEELSLTIRDQSGRVVHTERTRSEKGRNEFVFTEGNSLKRGTYIITLEGSGTASQKIIKN